MEIWNCIDEYMFPYLIQKCGSPTGRCCYYVSDQVTSTCISGCSGFTYVQEETIFTVFINPNGQARMSQVYIVDIIHLD